MTENDAVNKTADNRLPPLEVIQETFARATKNRLYGRKFRALSLNSWDDFFRLPMTDKEDLRASDPEDTLAVPRSEVWHYHESFGTTGKPISTWFTREDYEREADLTAAWTAPIKPGMLVLNRFPYSFAVPPFIIEVKCRRDGGIVVPADNANFNVPYTRTLEIMKRLRVDAIACLPLELVILEAVARRTGYDIERDFSSLKHVLVSGRIVPPALKEYMERRWGTSVTCVYGCTEGGGVASTCEAWQLHTHPHAFVLEIVDPQTRQPVPEGDTGVLVLTSYYRKAAPLFRYYTGDLCRRVTAPCPCGNPNPVIHVLGRVDDVIDLAGAQISFFDLEQPVLEFARQFDSVVYFVIVTDRRLHVRVETHNDCREPSAASAAKLRHALRVPLKIEVCPRGELLDAGFLSRSPSLYKPFNISDWRRDRRRCVTLTEALVEFPHLGLADCADISRRAVKNLIIRKTLR